MATIEAAVEMDTTTVVGTVLDLAIRTAEGAPMQPQRVVQARMNGALDGHGKVEPDRGITLLSARQWAEVVRELGRDISWHARRANVLLDAEGLLPLVGRTIRIGGVSVLVCDETRPCGIMDQQAAGLREILKKDGRGGVHGRILNDGAIRIGDEARLVAESRPFDPMNEAVL